MAQKPLFHDGLLRYRYMEMVGESGHHMHTVLQPYLPSDDYFFGADTDPKYIMGHVLGLKRETGPAPFQLGFGDFFNGVKLFLKAPNGPKPGIINVDTTNAIRAKWWEGATGRLREIVEEAKTFCPRFVVILNHTLDRGSEVGMSVEDRIRLHVSGLAKTFTNWKLTEKRLLQGTEKASQSGFTGRAGPFEIYRSNHTVRMITIRLAFDKARREAITEKETL